MNEEVGMVALKEVTSEEFLDLAQNGARELFTYWDYRVLDGVKGENQSHFVHDTETDRWYLIDKDTCYELVTAFYCGGHKAYIRENLEEIINSIK